MDLDPHTFVLAALCRYDDTGMSQLVKDAVRSGYRWDDAPPPNFPARYRRLRAVYAALVELFALRDGYQPPAWTQNVEPAPAPVYLLPGCRTSDRARRYSMLTTPSVMRRRNVFALRDYMDFTFGRSEKTSILSNDPPPWDPEYRRTVLGEEEASRMRPFAYREPEALPG